MAGPSPESIWQSGLDEGERRLARPPAAHLATGLFGGFDVMLGILAVVVTTGTLTEVLPEDVAHLLGSLTFGIAFVFITIGRSELFTENFLVPVGAVLERGRGVGELARMWGLTFVANLVGLTVLALLLSMSGVLEQSSLEAAGTLAETFAARDLLAAFVSAVVAGLLMTLFTWLSASASTDNRTRLAVAMLVGFLLAAPTLNHSVVGFGEILFGVLAGTSEATLVDLAQNLPVAIAGNLLGGVGFVTLTRLVQARGERGDDLVDPDEDEDEDERGLEDPAPALSSS